jgi:hypothetical protein
VAPVANFHAAFVVLRRGKATAAHQKMKTWPAFRRLSQMNAILGYGKLDM